MSFSHLPERFRTDFLQSSECSLRVCARRGTVRRRLSLLFQSTIPRDEASVLPEVTHSPDTPLAPRRSVHRGVFNHRSTATVESRSRRERPGNWHTLPAGWQLPPVPPRSCNPRHAQIHGPRRRSGNRLGRSSDASCPCVATTPNLSSPPSSQVPAAACESSCFTVSFRFLVVFVRLSANYHDSSIVSRFRCRPCLPSGDVQRLVSFEKWSVVASRQVRRLVRTTTETSSLLPERQYRVNKENAGFESFDGRDDWSYC